MKRNFFIVLIINFILLNSIHGQSRAYPGSFFNGRYYLIAEFKEIPKIEIQHEMEKQGINILEYISGKNYVVSVSAESLDDFKIMNNLVKIREIDKNLKMDIRLNNPPAYCTHNDYIDVVVLYFEDISKEVIEKEIKKVNLQITHFVPSLHHFVARIPRKDVVKISSYPWLKYITPIPPPFVSDNFLEKITHRANIISATYPGARNLSGKGVKVGEWDSGPLGEHVDLKGRTFLRENKVAVSNHATHVAGTVLGSGVIDPMHAGMAPQAEIYSWDFWDWIPYEMDTCVKYDSIVITQNSYAYDPNWDTCKNRGYYDIYSYLLDRLVRLHPNLIHVYAAGNWQSQCGKGGYRTISSGPQSAKNVIDAGAVTYLDQMSGFSSWGPVRDGRLKPDVCAVGVSVMSTTINNNYGQYSGTSMACPGTSGTLALLYEHYRKIFQQDPDASTMKAILCNTADDLENPGPDYKTGFGRINALKAAQTIEEKRFKFDSLSYTQIRRDTIKVPSGTRKLKVLLCWSDVPASMYKPYDSISLINNLDLRVVDPNNTSHYPLILDTSNFSKTAFQGIDYINNIEQVVIDSPFQGNYIIIVSGTWIPAGYQTYTITYEFQKDEISVIYPNGGESLTPQSTVQIFWAASGTSSNFALEYSLNNGQSWQNINNNITSTARNYSWIVPDVVSSKCLIRITSGSLSDISDTTFSIMKQPYVLNTKPCSGQMYLYWPKVSKAKTYDVFLEVNGQMVKQTNTSDTFYTIKGLDNKKSYYFSINANDSTGARSVRMNAIISALDSTIAPPVIIYQTPGDTVCPGTSKLLRCQFAGKNPIYNQWQISTDQGKKWNDITGATDTFLALTNIQKNQDGWRYRIRYTNECLSVEYSDEIEIRVDQGITFDFPYLGFTKCIGDSAGFKAVAKSITPIQAIWQKSTDTVNWTDISGATDSLLIFDSLVYGDNGFYRVHASNACVSDTFSYYSEAVVHPPLSLDLLVSSDTICYGQTISLTGQTSGGDSSAYMFIWGNIGGINNQAFDTLYQSGKFFLSVYDNCSIAIVEDSVEVIVRPPLTVEIVAVSDTICQGQQMVLKTVVNGGNANYFYQWNTGSYSDSIVVSPMRDSMFVVVVTDSCSSLTAADSIKLYVRPPLSLDIYTVSDTVCFGSQVFFSSKSSGGLSSGYQILWNTGNSGPNMSLTADTSRWIKAELIDNCTTLSAYDSFYLFVRPPLKIEAYLSQDTVCAGNEIIVQTKSSGGYKYGWLYQWDNYATNDSFLKDKVFLSKKYVVHLSDGCTTPSVSDSVELYVRPPLQVKLSASDDTICNGDKISFLATATGGNSAFYSFNWNITNDTLPKVDVKLFENKVVKVILKDYCTEKNPVDSVEIFVHQLNAAWKSTELNYRYVMFEPEDTLSARYLWDFGDSSSSTDKIPIHLYGQNGTFRVCLTVSNYDHCDSTYCKEIYVENPFINGYETSGKFIVFPNPNSGEFRLMGINKNEHFRYSLMNILGEKISGGELNCSGQTEIKTPGKGIFILLIYNEKEKYSLKVMTQ